MTLIAIATATAMTPPVILGLAGALAVIGFVGLLPRPRGRAIILGAACSTAAVLVAAFFTIQAFGQPLPDLLGQILFWLFSAGSLIFGAALVTQKNPARGAIAFAFVVMSTCGLFLLLAAPFLMAVTVIVYAGAIIVTFMFVLMLSFTGGPSDENDRTREPLLGSVAGFGFAGLVLFALYQTANHNFTVPTPPLSEGERQRLMQAHAALNEAIAASSKDEILKRFQTAYDAIEQVVGGKDSSTSPETLQNRLRATSAKPADKAIVDHATQLKQTNQATLAKLENNLIHPNADFSRARDDMTELKHEVLAFAGYGLLPSRNIGTLGMLLYSEHLLAVELAGTLLLVATIGAVAIAGKKGVTA
jgi:NADH:ubiquinone oxidoreductase subunit 6 (subunit J)